MDYHVTASLGCASSLKQNINRNDEFPGFGTTQDDAAGVKKRDAALRGKKDVRKDRKDKGYIMFEEEDSEEELVAENPNKSPTKVKKHAKPSFKFTKKDKAGKSKDKEKDEKKEKEKKEKDKEKVKEKKDKEEKEKQDKEKKEKSEKELKKDDEGGLKPKWRKKILLQTKQEEPVEQEDLKPVFGVQLTVAVERNPCHDGIQLPAVIRECIDYISEYGLACEGIYRVSGVKSKVQQLKDSYNKGVPVYLPDHEPNVVASLLKQFLRELPEPVLTIQMMPKFEQASTLKNVKQKVEQFHQLINELPLANRLLLSWVIVHMTQVIAREKQNKMSLQNVSIVLSPTMQISHRVLNVFFTYSKILFHDTVIKRYVPPLKPATSRWTLELPDSPSAIEEELKKQESLLNHLHEELMKVKDNSAHAINMEKEEQLWEVQRVVTQLKRKLKHAKQMSDEMTLRKEEESAREKKMYTILHQKTAPRIHEEEIHEEVVGEEVPPQQPPEVIEMTQDDELKLELKQVDDKTEVKQSEDETKQVVLTQTEEVKKTTDVVQSEDGTKSVEPGGDGIEGDAKNTDSKEAEVEEKITEVKEEEIVEEIPKVEVLPSDAKEVIEETETEDIETAEGIRDEENSVAESSVQDNLPETKTDAEPVIENSSRAEPIKIEQLPEESVVTDTVIVETAPVEGPLKVQESKSTEADVTAETEKHELDKETLVISKVELEVAPADERLDSFEETDDSSDAYTDVLEDDEDDDRSLEVPSIDGMKGVEGILGDYVKLGEESPHWTDRVNERGLMGDQGAVGDKGTLLSTDGSGIIGADDGNSFSETTTSSEHSLYGDEDDEEYENLLRDHTYYVLEEEELLAIGDELRQKIATEKNEIERLHQDIAELQMMRQDAYETSSSASSTSSSSSSSSDDDMDVDELQEILKQLVKENDKLEADNSEMCEKIHQEREICMGTKVRIRMIQQRHLESSGYGLDLFTDQESLL